MKKLFIFSIILALLLTSCAGSTPNSPAAQATQPPVPSPVSQTVVVKETVIVPPTPAPEQPVTLTFWHAYNETSPENQMLTETLIPMFEQAHPNIKVKSLSVPYEDFRRKLITAISGGVAPDLIRSDIIWVPELADMGALVPLDVQLPDFTALKENLFPGPLSTNLWNGHYYGLPLDTNTKVWLYNKELYDAAGITAPAQNISELESQCKALKQAKPDAYLFAADGTFAWVVLPWIWSMGGDILDPQLTTATGYLNGPKTVATYEFWLKMYKEGCFAPVVLGNGIDPFTGFAQDLYANIDNGPWTYPIVASQYPDKQVYASPFPSGEGGSIDVVGGEDAVVFQQSRHPAEAMEFLRFMLSPDYQLKMAEVGQIPVRADLVNGDYLKNYPYYTAFLEQLKTARARPAHPAWSQMDEAIIEAGQLILREEMTPQQALDQAAAKIDAMLKK
jgi:ABC-type glycerol-3-phosphate transport system substrate-binding protein